jgi:hypothetical protein
VAPLAVRIVDSPSQIKDGDALALIDNELPTKTVTDAKVEQPLVVPVTE